MTKAKPAPPCIFGDRRVQQIVDCFDLTRNQMGLTSGFKKELIDYHEGNWVLPKESLFKYINELGHQFKHFALLHKEFLSLPKGDQRKLLQRNTPLYIQYILARYITAHSGEEQISWLLGKEALENYDTKEDINKKTLKRLNQHLNLFNIVAPIERYLGFAKKATFPSMRSVFESLFLCISRFFKIIVFRFNCLKILAHLLIYQHDDFMNLEACDDLKTYLDHAWMVCPHAQYSFQCVEKPNVPVVIEALEKMARFFAQNVIWHDFVKDNPNKDSVYGDSPSSSHSGSPLGGTELWPR